MLAVVVRVGVDLVCLVRARQEAAEVQRRHLERKVSLGDYEEGRDGVRRTASRLCRG